MSAESGIPALVTSTANAAAALAGEDVGTWFSARGVRRSTRMLWLAHLASTRGRLELDAGAVRAISAGTASLLPAGIIGVSGSFEAGDAVEITDAAGAIIARGLVNFSSAELPQMLGRTTQDLGEDLGSQFERSVVHVDDLVLV